MAVIYVKSPRGELGTIPEENFEAAAQAGFTRASPQEVTSGVRTAEESALATSPTGSFLAGTAATLRGATLGAYDTALKAAGVEQSTLDLLSKASPITTAVSEAGGSLATLGAPAGIVGKAAARAVLPGGAKTFGEMLLSRGAQATAEGLTFGAAQTAAKAAQDPEFTAEAALAETGLAGLLSGATSLALSGAGKVPALAVALTKKGARGFYEGLSSANTIGRRALGDIPSMYDVASSGKFTPEGMAAREALINTKQNIAATASELQTAVKDIVSGAKPLATELSSSGKAARIAEQLSGTNVETSRAEALNLIKQAGTKISEMRAEPDLYKASGVIRDLETQLYGKGTSGDVSGAINRINSAKDANEVFTTVDNLKRRIDAILYPWGKAPTAEAAKTIESVKDIRRSLMTHLEDSTVYGEAANTQKQINSTFSSFEGAKNNLLLALTKTQKTGSGGKTSVFSKKKISDFLKAVDVDKTGPEATSLAAFLDATNALEQTSMNLGIGANRGLIKLTEAAKGVGSKRETLLGVQEAITTTPDSLAGAAAGMADVGIVGRAARQVGLGDTALQTATKTLQMEKLGQRISSKLDNIADSLVNGTMRVTGKAKFGTVSPKVAEYFLGDKGVGEFASVAYNPEALQKRITEATKDLEGQDSDIAAMIGMKLSTGAGALANKFPSGKATTNSLNPLASVRPSSPYEKYVFNKYLKTIDDPIGALETLGARGSPQETVAVLSAVYPKLMDTLREKISEKAAKSNKPLPYKQRVLMSALFGSPMDDSVAPSNIKTIQQGYGKAAVEVNKSKHVDKISNQSLTTIGRLTK